jgi:hypothetical protein
MRHLADTSPDPLVQLIGRAAWGVQCWQVGHLPEAADAMQQVLELQAALGPRDRARLSEYGATLTAPWAVFVLELAGRVDDGERRLEQLAASFPDPYARVVVANFGALAGFCTGDPNRAARWAARGLADDHGRGFSFVAAACRVTAGWATAVTVDPVGGLATLEAGLAQFRATGARTVLGLLIPMHAEALLAAGRPVEQAREVLERGAAEVLASGEEICLPYLELARALIAEAEGADAATHRQRAEEEAARLRLAVAMGRSRVEDHGADRVITAHRVRGKRRMGA